MSEGRVEVDGEVVTQLGAKVDPETRGDPGRRQAASRSRRRTSTSSRTSRAVSSARWPTRRAAATCASLVGDRPERLFHVGRLDTDTDGLIVLTNDGEFAHRLAHPSFELQQDLRRPGRRVVKPRVRRQLLRRESSSRTGRSTVDAFRVVSTQVRDRSLVELVMHEGRNRIVRRMLDRGRASGAAAVAHRDRADPARRPASRARPRADHRRARHPARRRRPLSASCRSPRWARGSTDAVRGRESRPTDLPVVLCPDFSPAGREPGAWGGRLGFRHDERSPRRTRALVGAGLIGASVGMALSGPA